MPYRAPELFDPPRDCRLDCRTDVWGIGCLLFAWWFGYSPFECEFNDQGQIRVTECSHSRVLSKINRKRAPHLTADDAVVYELTEWTLQRDFAIRPFTSDVITRVEEVLASLQTNASGNSNV